MTWRTHVLIGLNSLWLLGAWPGMLNRDRLGPLCALAAFGALLPDLDAAQAKIRHLGLGGLRPFAPLAALLHRRLGHRGLLHSPVGLLLLACLVVPLAFGWGAGNSLALALGYASHLLADACTKSGIPLWPGRGRRLHLLPPCLRLVTGSLAEDALLPLLALPVFLLLLRCLLLSS